MKDRQEWKGPIRRIQDAVCREFEVKHIALISDRRHYDIIPARHICFFLCRELTTASLPTIGVMFGRRDHTTVMNGIKNAKRLMAEQPHLKVIADDIIAGWKDDD